MCRVSDCRNQFETWISAPPYERDVFRYPMNEMFYTWPGQYRDIAVQLAWEAWQEAVEACQRAAPAR